MELQEAINICKEMQKWRRGEGKYSSIPSPMPYSAIEYGIAIDKLIEQAEEE